MLTVDDRLWEVGTQQAPRHFRGPKAHVLVLLQSNAVFPRKITHGIRCQPSECRDYYLL